MYRVIESALTCYYWLAFSGAPVDEGLSSDNSLGWESSMSSASGYASQVGALERVLSSRFQDAGFKFGVRPSGRPMSEEASVELSRYGDRWVIQLYYSTAWEPNSSDIDSFFLGLPEGEYGVAFLDADDMTAMKLFPFSAASIMAGRFCMMRRKKGRTTALIAMNCGSF